MKREIKFRGWCEDFGEFKMCHYSPMEPCDNGLWFGIEEHFHSSQTHQIMQYTGLKDKNGKEIYEGDILKKSEPKPMNGRAPRIKIVGSIKKVTFHEGAFRLTTSLTSRKYLLNSISLWYYGFEVIGNIYETPELLNSDPTVKECDARDGDSSNTDDQQIK